LSVNIAAKHKLDSDSESVVYRQLNKGQMLLRDKLAVCNKIQDAAFVVTWLS